MKNCRKPRKSDAKKTVSNHLITLHQRLYQTLNLGFRYSEDKEKEWYTSDIEMQRLIIRSISAFLVDISPDTLHIPLVKDSVADIVRALTSMIQSPNDTVTTMASELLVKLSSMLPSSLLQPHVGHLCYPLSSLLSNHRPQVAIMSATALNLILSEFRLKKENKMLEILHKHNLVTQIICNLQKCLDNVTPIEYFVEMASLLSSVLHIWPHTRYPVWTDAKVKEVMEHFCCKPETSVKVAVLQLYSAIALCGCGAKKYMEKGELFVKTIVHCMGKSQPHSVRILGFKVARRLMAYEGLCSKVLSFSCKPVVESIISAMSCSSILRGEASNEEVSLLMEACRLALITRWPGKHHDYFWKFGIDKCLYILMFNSGNVHPHPQSWSIEELISVVREGLKASFLVELRAYVWEIVGSLSAQCEEDFHPDKDKNKFYIRVLITSACLAFTDSIGRERQCHLADRLYTLSSISAAKAVLMMMYSPCEYIVFQTRLILSEVLKFEAGNNIKHLLKEFYFVNSEDTSVPDEAQMLISLMALSCYSGLPQCYRLVVRHGGVNALLTFVRWWFRNEVHIRGVNPSSRLRDIDNGQVCCRMEMEDWEGREIHLFWALRSVAELINCHVAEGCTIDIFARQTTYVKDLFIHDIQDICIRTSSSGLRWYSSYLLSLFGIYGFPSQLGEKITSLFCEKDYGDMYLVLRDGQRVSVHKVVLLVRCPSFLPPEDSFSEETSNSFLEDQTVDKIHKTKKEVSLSSRVDEQALLKVLEFIYSGSVHAEEELVRKLKVLAKYCNIQPLLHLLCKKRPKWGASVPSIDLITALGPAGRDFSDVILEAKSTTDTGWTSNCCSLSVPHIHSHRAILMSSCNYLRAVFQSGMQESRSQFLKVPVSWEALQKLVVWVYSNDAPKPVSGCIWDNMDVEKKMFELRPYVELCWLAEFWFIDDLQNFCSELVASLLDSPELSIEVLQCAASFSQWEMVDVAANRIAPFFRNLRFSGALDVLDEGLVEIIRLAFVRLSQE